MSMSNNIGTHCVMSRLASSSRIWTSISDNSTRYWRTAIFPVV